MQLHHPAKLMAGLKGFKACGLIILVSFVLKLWFMTSSDLLVEEAYYWNYAQHLDWGYLDHPPMVAVLIHWFTRLFGQSELAVRLPALFCWIVTAYFSYQLSQLIARGTGIYAILFLSILPFFFLQSLVITPDLPLMAFWSALLYFLYRILVLGQGRYWLVAGIFLGLGLLSKYTIGLLGLPTFAYICLIPQARFWLQRKEPYLALMVALIVFSPVIYWNVTHDWASFLFQSQRRLNDRAVFSLHEMLGILLMFLTPIGLAATTLFCSKRENLPFEFNENKYRFIQFFTFIPLVFFAMVSLSHPVKFNWIGPTLLACIPWLAWIVAHTRLSSGQVSFRFNYIRRYWILNAIILLLIYACMEVMVIFAVPAAGYKSLLTKFIAWSDLTSEFNQLAQKVENNTHQAPIFVPLDSYNIASELSYYQHKSFIDGEINIEYPIMSAYRFGIQTLMYQYWDNQPDLTGKILILISSQRHDFENLRLKNAVTALSPIRIAWGRSQGTKVKARSYYYQMVSMKL